MTSDWTNSKGTPRNRDTRNNCVTDKVVTVEGRECVLLPIPARPERQADGTVVEETQVLHGCLD